MNTDNPYDSSVVKTNLGNLLSKNYLGENEDTTVQKSKKTLKNLEVELTKIIEKLKSLNSKDESALAILDGEDANDIPKEFEDFEQTNGLINTLFEHCNNIKTLVAEQEIFTARLLKIIG